MIARDVEGRTDAVPKGHGRFRQSHLEAPAMRDSETQERRELSRAELAATLALGWPLILTNLAQTGLTTAIARDASARALQKGSPLGRS